MTSEPLLGTVEVLADDRGCVPPRDTYHSTAYPDIYTGRHRNGGERAVDHNSAGRGAEDRIPFRAPGQHHVAGDPAVGSRAKVLFENFLRKPPRLRPAAVTQCAAHLQSAASNSTDFRHNDQGPLALHPVAASPIDEIAKAGVVVASPPAAAECSTIWRAPHRGQDFRHDSVDRIGTSPCRWQAVVGVLRAHHGVGLGCLGAGGTVLPWNRRGVDVAAGRPSGAAGSWCCGTERVGVRGVASQRQTAI